MAAIAYAACVASFQRKLPLTADAPLAEVVVELVQIAVELLAQVLDEQALHVIGDGIVCGSGKPTAATARQTIGMSHFPRLSALAEEHGNCPCIKSKPVR